METISSVMKKYLNRWDNKKKLELLLEFMITNEVNPIELDTFLNKKVKVEDEIKECVTEKPSINYRSSQFNDENHQSFQDK
jgi:hypothetical protein